MTFIVTGIRAHVSRRGGYITVGVQSVYQNSLDLFSALDSFIAGWKPETTVTETKEPETLSRLSIVRNQGEARKAINSCSGGKHTITFEIPKEKRFLSKAGLFSILISELCHIGCSRNCSLVLTTSSKLTSGHISSSSLVQMFQTDIVLRESNLLRLPLKIRFPPYFSRSSSTNSFHFPWLDLSRYLRIHVVLRDLLKEVKSTIFKSAMIIVAYEMGSLDLVTLVPVYLANKPLVCCQRC